MKKIMMLLMLILLSSFAYANWVIDPSDCPTEYQSQTCTGSDVVCGYDSGITYCYDPINLSAPETNLTSTTDHSGSFDGGYLINCTAYDGSAPHCDNSGAFWCDRNSTCYSGKNRDTVCVEGQWGVSACGNCTSGRQDCVGDDICEVVTGTTDCVGAPAGWNNRYTSGCSCICDSGFLDCDSSGVNTTNGCEVEGGVTQRVGYSINFTLYGSTCDTWVCDTNYYSCDGESGGNDSTGCEILYGESCTSTGGIPGTCTGCGSTGTDANGNDCNCTVIPPVNFQTGVEAGYNTTNPLLWGKQNGTGPLMNLSSPSASFVVNNSGCIVFDDGSTLCNGTEGTAAHSINGSMHTGNLSTSRVVKDTGTNFFGRLMDYIIDTLYSMITDVNSSALHKEGSETKNGNLTINGTLMLTNSNKIVFGNDSWIYNNGSTLIIEYN